MAADGHSPFNQSSSVKSRILRGARKLRDEIRQLPDFAVFLARAPTSPYKKALRERVVDPLDTENTKHQGNKSSKEPKKNFDGNPAVLLSTAMKLADKLPHELTYDDIMRASHYEGRTISNSISVVFAAHKLDQLIWAHNRIERESARFPDLIAEYRTTYPPPWGLLRNILSAMRDAAGDNGLFDFDFSDPEDHQLRLSNYEQFSFKAEMTNRTMGARTNSIPCPREKRSSWRYASRPSTSSWAGVDPNSFFSTNSTPSSIRPWSRRWSRH